MNNKKLAFLAIAFFLMALNANAAPATSGCISDLSAAFDAADNSVTLAVAPAGADAGYVFVFKNSTGVEITPSSPPAGLVFAFNAADFVPRTIYTVEATKANCPAVQSYFTVTEQQQVMQIPVPETNALLLPLFALIVLFVLQHKK